MINTRISEEAVALACVAFIGEATEKEVELIFDKMYNALYAVDKFAETHLILEPDVGDIITVMSTYDGKVYPISVHWDGSYWVNGDRKFETDNLKAIYFNNNFYTRVEQGIQIFKKVSEYED